MDSEGWVHVDELIERLEGRNLSVDPDRIRTVVERDPKGRYEINGSEVRARYGHSLDGVDPTLPSADVEVLYHGTSPDAAESILTEGLQKQGRQKVHLSSTVEEARKVGQRHCREPVVLQVDARGALQAGNRIERASDVVYVADEISADHLTRLGGC